MSNDNTDAIESLRTFALAHNEIAFAHICTAALAGEERPSLLMRHVFAEIGTEVFTQYRSRATEEIEAIALDVIRATDTTRPDGNIARTLIDP